MTRYTQHRLAKRNGEIVQQRRWQTVDVVHRHPPWKFWYWGLYDVVYNYGEWEDIPFANADEVENNPRTEKR